MNCPGSRSLILAESRYCPLSEPLKPLPLEEHPWLKSLRALRDYYAEFFSCVWRETRGFFGWNWRTALVPTLFLVGLIVAFFTLEGEVVRDELLTSLAFGLAPVGGLAVLITLVNIIRAPYLLDRERLSLIRFFAASCASAIWRLLPIIATPKRLRDLLCVLGKERDAVAVS